MFSSHNFIITDGLLHCKKKDGGVKKVMSYFSKATKFVRQGVGTENGRPQVCSRSGS